MRKIKVKSKTVRAFMLLILMLLIIIGIITGCDITKPEEVIQAGRLKIKLLYKFGDGTRPAGENMLLVQARDFKIFNDNHFADVFQHPGQFLESPDSIVQFNIYTAARKDSLIQVAYGSIPPFEYDSLYFQITPIADTFILDGRIYPLSTDYKSLPIENNFSKVVKIREKINVEENKTTTVVFEFKVEENIFRILDEYVFSAAVDTFYIVNE